MEITGKYAASTLLLKQGIVLDTNKACYRKTQKILSFLSFSEPCKPLPKLDYVLMFRTLYANCEPCTLEDFENTSLIQLSLVYHKNRRLIVHESKNTQEIREMAATLASAFQLRIRDAASDRKHPKWLR